MKSKREKEKRAPNFFYVQSQQKCFFDAKKDEINRDTVQQLEKQGHFLGPIFCARRNMWYVPVLTMVVYRRKSERQEKKTTKHT